VLVFEGSYFWGVCCWGYVAGWLCCGVSYIGLLTSIWSTSTIIPGQRQL